MTFDLYPLSLSSELARWQPHALEAIVRPDYWAMHGTTRMGKALTADDRVPDVGLDPNAHERGRAAAKMVMELLSLAEGSRVRWSEADDDASAPRESATSEGVRLLAAAAHALQAGTLEGDAGARAILACVASPPPAAERPRGLWSAILAMATDTLWLPVSLESTWDSPFGVVASAVRLREDLARLPAALRALDPNAPADLQGAQALVRTLERVLDAAGTTRGVRMTG